MISENHRKEMASRAFVHSIVSKAGYVMSSPNLDYGIDVSVTQVRERQDSNGIRLVEGFEFKIQLKSSSGVNVEDGQLIYDLEAKSFNDLADSNTNVPRILVLVHLPCEEGQWITISDESILLKNCAYYADFSKEMPTKNKSSIRIRIPLVQKFNPKFITQFFSKIERGDI